MRFREAQKTARESAKSQAPGVEPVFPEKDHAIDYAQNRASFRSAEIRILDLNGNIERTIPFSDADRRLALVCQ
jgi:hypothetical protein